MNEDANAKRERAPRGAARLRLVARPPATVDLLPGSYDVRFISKPGRPDGRPEKGTSMSLIDRTIHAVGRFAVGFGTALALVCAVVIVTTGPRLDAPSAAAPAEVIRLDPVVVTISASRYAELQSTLREPSVVVRAAGHRAAEG